MEINYKVWLEEDGAVLFGKGREELLEAIDELRTLSGAAKRLEMSYRAAWGRLRASEKRLGFKLVEQDPRRRIMSLTADGKELLRCYKVLREEMSAFLNEATPRIFGGLRQNFPGRKNKV
ncbi:MAG: LysR family transcriptional regulator [Pseudomonadota bacterium]